MRHRVLILIVVSLFFEARAAALHLQGGKWPDGHVRVCWHPDSFDSPYTALNGQLIRDAVDNTWGRNADLRFVDWGRCGASTKGWIVISWSRGRPSESEEDDYGYSKSRATPVELLPSFSRGEVYANALHEFGHALGFGREEQSPVRKATDLTCSSAKASGTEVLTPYDRESVVWCSGRGRLSEWDLVGLRKAYGFKPRGTLVGLNNRALDIQGASTATGIPLQVWNHHGAWNQGWSRTGVFAETFQANYRGTRRCVAVPGPGSGTGLESRACDTTAGQQFVFANVALRGIGGKCLDVPNAEFRENQVVQLYDCHGGENQRWTIEPGFVNVSSFLVPASRIHAGTTGYCLEVPDGDAEKKALLQLSACDDGPAQKFTFHANGQIRFRGLCLDTQDGVPSNGARLQLDQCRTKAQNQIFHLTGAVKQGGLCLDIRGGVAFDGAVAQMFTCHGGPNQVWDYYFK